MRSPQTSRWFTRTRLACISLAMISLLLPLQNTVYLVFVMKVMCFALFACALNLLVGYAGLLSFGHAAFFGTAAYVTAYAGGRWGWTPELAVIGGVVVSAAMGALFGALAIRRQGIYFAMITLALAQMVYFIAVQSPATQGEDGLPVPRGRLLGLVDLRDDVTMYYVLLVVCGGGFALVSRVVRSPFGEVLRSIRENEPRALSLGYDVRRFKWLAFVLSATVTGLAGSMKALVFELATLTDVHWQMSGEVVVAALLGGIGTLAGPVVGAAVVVGLKNYLASVGSWSTIAMGFIFMACVLSFRRGIVGELLAPRVPVAGRQRIDE